MAFIFSEGFDAYGAVSDIEDRWPLPNGTTNLSLVSGRDSEGQALRVGTSFNGAVIRWPVPTAAPNRGLGGRPTGATTFIFGFDINIDALPSVDQDILRLADDAGVVAARLSVNSTGNLEWKDGSVTRHTSTSQLIAGSYTYVEVKVVLHDGVGGSAGSCSFKFAGGGAEASGTIDTINNETICEFNLLKAHTQFQMDVDNVYLCNGMDEPSGTNWNDFLTSAASGNIGVRIETIHPSGVGNSSGWTPDSGANWDRVDDGAASTHDGDTSYVETGVSGTKDTHVFDDLSDIGASDDIVGVALCVTARKVDTGVPSICAVARHSSSESTTDALGFATGSTYYVNQDLVEDNPSTSSAWTAAEIDAAEFGYEAE